MITEHMGNQEALLSNVDEYTKMMVEAIKFSGDFTTQCTAIEILCNLHSLKFNESLEHLVGNGIVYGETEKKMLKLRSKSRKSINDIRDFVMGINDDDSIVSITKRVWSLKARRIQLDNTDVTVKSTPWVDFGAESLSFDKRWSPSKSMTMSDGFTTHVVQYRDIDHVALDKLGGEVKFKISPKAGTDFGSVQTLAIELSDEAFSTFMSRVVDRVKAVRVNDDERTGITAGSITLASGLPITPTTTEERRVRKESFTRRASGAGARVLSEIDTNAVEKRTTRKSGRIAASTNENLGAEVRKAQAPGKNPKAPKQAGERRKNQCPPDAVMVEAGHDENNTATVVRQEPTCANGGATGYVAGPIDTNYSDTLSQINNALFSGLQAIETEIADMEHKTVEFESDMEVRCQRLAKYKKEAERLQKRLAETMKKQYSVFAQRRESVLEKGRAVLESLRREQAFDFDRIDS